jgi:hypothetical protein
MVLRIGKKRSLSLFNSNPEVSQDAHPSLAATKDVVDTLIVP